MLQLKDVLCLYGSSKQALATSDAEHFPGDRYVHAKVVM